MYMMRVCVCWCIGEEVFTAMRPNHNKHPCFIDCVITTLYSPSLQVHDYLRNILTIQ